METAVAIILIISNAVAITVIGTIAILFMNRDR